MKNLDLMLKNVALEEILSFKRHIPSKSNDIWGKHVIRVDKNNVVHEDELENWYVQVPIKDVDINSFIMNAKALLSNCELSRIYEKELAMAKWNDYTIHQLCDWRFLENDDGTVIKDGVVTFVKYAIVLKNFEEDDCE